MPGDWFEQNAQIWQPQPQQPQGGNIEQGPAAPRPSFDLAGAQVHGRNADTKDANDLLWLASQQPGFDISSNAAAQQTFQNIIQPMFQQQGLQAQLGGRNLDRVVTNGGRTLDFIGNAGNADTSKRRFWVGDSANPGPSAAAPMALGSLGSLAAPPSADLYRRPDAASTDIAAQTPAMAQIPAPGMGGTGPQLQQDAQQQEAWLRAQAQQASQRPQTMQGPQPMALRIPGFANGVQNFEGGPAVVGEKGPELLNLPPGSDVTPMTLGGLGQMPGVGTPGGITLGAGGGLPSPGGEGAITMGGGATTPPIGTPTTLGADRFQMPALAGGTQAQWNAPGPAPWEGQSGYAYNPMAGPQNYNPAALAGPDRLSLGSIGQPGAIRADQVGLGQQVTAGMVQPGQRVTADRIGAQGVQTPAQIAAERVQGPAALQLDRLQDPGAFHNLSASELQTDPSYQFRLQQSLGAIQNSAAAKGMLHSPNTIAALRDQTGQAASQEYAAANARALGVQQQNFGNQATVAGQNNASAAQAYGLTNQYQQQAALANQGANLEAGKFNVGTGLQAGMFNAQQGQSADQFNAANALQSGQFNSAQQQQANLANVGNALQAGQFNSQQGQQAALANQGANLQAGQFNANQDFQTQQANLQNQLAAYTAYQPLAQQNSQFNAAQQASAAQNNFANQFSVNQANNAGSLGAFNANLGAELGRGNLGVSQGQLALGNRQADQSYGLGLGNLALGNRQADQSYSLGQGNLALGNRSADQSYDLGLRNNALGYYGAQNSYNLGLGNLGVSQGQLGLAQQGQAYNQDANTFNTNYGIYRDNRDTQFNQNLALAQIGAGAAGNYGNQAGALYSGQGNANAGAAIGQGNAWAGALGNIGNAAGQLAYWNNQPRQAGYGPAGAPPPSPYGYG